MNKYITAGELARLASTTKRTIHFYDEKGILRPVRVDSNKYRLYEERQILEYQMILLLTTLGVSLDEIRQYIRQKGDLGHLFHDKQLLMQQEIDTLQFHLRNVNKFLTNLKSNGTLVNPTIKTVSPFGVLYIEKIGPYSKIEEYCQELLSMIHSKSTPTTLAIFEGQTYQPKRSKIIIGLIDNAQIAIKSQYKENVKHMVYRPGKVITYTHNGSANLLSLFWKELEKYCRLHNIKPRKGVSDFEIYRKPNNDIAKQFFEIYLPIH